MKTLEEIKNNKRLVFKSITETSTGVELIGEIYTPYDKKPMLFVFSNGYGWEHLSVSYPYKLPTWDQMQFAKEQFWTDDECCVQFHPRKKDYVNVHSYVLHIWRDKAKGHKTPPYILTGVKGHETKAEIDALYKALDDGQVYEED